MSGQRELVKRKHVSVKLKRLRMPSSDSNSNGITLNVSAMKKNNKLLARALNESREKTRDLEESIMALRTENVELRVQVSDLKAQVHEVSEGGKDKEFTEIDLQEHLVNYLEPMKGIFHQALDHTVALSAEITRAMTYIKVPQVTRRRSSASLSNGFASIKFADRPRNKVKKVSPMVSGHIVHKPDIKIKKLDMSSLLGTAQSQGLRFSRGEPELDADQTRILENEDMEIEPDTTNIVDIIELPVREEDEVNENVNNDQVKKFLTRTYQPRVSLRPFDVSLIEEEDEEDEEVLPRRRNISRNTLSDIRKTEIIDESSIEEDDRTIPCVDLENENDMSNSESTVSQEDANTENKVTESLEGDVVIVPKEVSDEFSTSPPQFQSKDKKQSNTAVDRRETFLVNTKTHIEEETPKSKTDISEKMFLDVIEDDPQEGPSWLFEDLFNPNKRGAVNRQSSRRLLRRKASSCSKKLSFVNYCPDPRELRPYDDGSSSDDLSFDEDETYKIKAPAKSQSQSKSKGKRSRADSIVKSNTKSKRSKVEKQNVSSSTVVDNKDDDYKSKISVNTVSEKTEENKPNEAEDTSTNSGRRPKRAAAALAVSLKEPSLSSKLRNPNSMKEKKRNSKSRKKSD